MEHAAHVFPSLVGQNVFLAPEEWAGNAQGSWEERERISWESYSPWHPPVVLHQDKFLKEELLAKGFLFSWKQQQSSQVVGGCEVDGTGCCQSIGVGW
nr:uncharacterized protein LOC117979406 isoform X2 [Pan paniscus]